MMRNAVNDEERAGARSRLAQARDLMIEALNLIDGTPVATDSDAHLDMAIHNLADTIADMEAGAPVFTAQSRGSDALTPDEFGSPPSAAAPGTPWDSPAT